jgi:hypothetical protein
VLRVLDSLQLLTKHKVATPANWQRGEEAIIAAQYLMRPGKSIRKDGRRPCLICALYQIPLREPLTGPAARDRYAAPSGADNPRAPGCRGLLSTKAEGVLRVRFKRMAGIEDY